MRPARLVAGALVAAGLAALSLGSVANRAVPEGPPASGWQAVAWPFRRDAWPAGLAFECPAAACGTAMRAYLRPKRGFCANCDTGVVADAEVDATADLDLIADDFTPLAAGTPVSVGELVGRQRAYTLHPPRGAATPALGTAMTRRHQCDLVVAVAEGAADDRARTALAALLTSDRVTSWLTRQLDGR